MKRQSAKLITIPKRDAMPTVAVEPRIFFLRQQRVILDNDLAELYGVSVKRLNEQVNRNRKRFPADFMFRLNRKEEEVLRSQIATSNKGRGGRRYAPYAFTEHGAIMAATVLNSDKAVQMSVFIVRAFVRLREMLATNRQLAATLHKLENRLDSHDETIHELIEMVKELMAPKEPSQTRIGFRLPAAKLKN